MFSVDTYWFFSVRAQEDIIYITVNVLGVLGGGIIRYNADKDDRLN